MNKSYPRSRRVGDQIQRTLSELIRREVRDPRLGSITLTDVRVSPDLSHAKVFYSVLGGTKDPVLTQEILDSAAAMLRGRLGRALSLRHAPLVHFEADTLIEDGARMSALIRDAVKKDQALHQSDTPDEAADDDAEKK
ncbi:MAG TPA: 30S ribosome-binding factor RbfA [Steroidobacteraceae bacterium]|nr:30S ribosome-binding factor RbfA [Steroidobacteraceae bacterium]